MKPIRACVIGHPVDHSKSPLIHNHWLEIYGIHGLYEKMDVQPGTLGAAMNDLVKIGYAGFNVTLPYKEDIMALCHHIDDTARAVGAVNMVTIRDKKLYGTNTDAYGFIQNIRAGRPDYDFQAGRAVVIGAGGAARAVVRGLLDAGAEKITITNRTVEKAQAIRSMDAARIAVAEWGERSELLGDCSLLVNTTSLGMTGKDRLEMDLAGLDPAALVCDIVYAPLMTDLLLAAQARGNPVVTGIGMLIHQARPAFKEWFGVMPEPDAELERKLLA
ncbi:MAG: shikimate dehydrogenase [Micavibrio sp.]